MTEGEIDQSLSSGRFCAIRDFDSLPSSFTEKEYQLIDGLCDLMTSLYGEDLSHVSGDMWAAATFHVDVTRKLLSRQLICTLSDYLINHAKQHCVLVGVYDAPNVYEEGTANHYVGRVIVTAQELAVEKSLELLWNNQMTESEL